MRNLTTDEKNQIEEAINLIHEAQELVDQALEGTTHERHYDAYGKYGFSQLLGYGNRYDTSLCDLLNAEEVELNEEG